MLRQSVPILLLCCASILAQAQEISGLGGALRGPDNAHTFAWEMDYQRSLGEHAVFSAGWINEGHLPGHHRDGPIAQVWWRTTAFDPRLSLAAGVGPYAYFDTVPTTTSDGSHDDHGIGIIASAAASWRMDGPWSLQLRFNRIVTKHSADSSSLLLGAVYRLEGAATPSDSMASIQPAFDSEVDLLVGRTIVNTLESEDAFAAQIEYRRRLGPYWAWSVGLLNEGDANTQRRSGVMAEFWAGHEFLDRRVTAAIGIGPYLVFDIRKNPELVEASRERLAGILSLTFAYAPLPQWALRLAWHRIFAERSHDSDVLVLGAGYRF
jgi:hypothetical protein